MTKDLPKRFKVTNIYWMKQKNLVLLLCNSMFSFHLVVFLLFGSDLIGAQPAKLANRSHLDTLSPKVGIS